MRIVVVGATGNVGTSVLRSLEQDDSVESIVGVARRLPTIDFAKTTWARADISVDDLVAIFAGADCVIHLAWLIQPSRDQDVLALTNIEGSRRVFRAVAEANVRSLVYASSVGAYSPGPKDRLVDETWPTQGIPTSFYSRHKAQVERMLDVFEEEHPQIRVARLRPALIFKSESAAGVRRLFIGPLFPNFLLRKSLIAFVPRIENLRFQAVHAEDVADAYRLAATTDVRGAFNIAADPVLDPDELARLFDARQVKLSADVLRAAAHATWRLRLQPTPEGWVDMALQTPLLDSARAIKELGWSPRYTSTFALMDLVEGLREGRGLQTPPLSPSTGGPARLKEFVTGIGSRSGVG